MSSPACLESRSMRAISSRLSRKEGLPRHTVSPRSFSPRKPSTAIGVTSGSREFAPRRPSWAECREDRISPATGLIDHFPFALQDMNGHGALPVGMGGELFEPWRRVSACCGGITFSTSPPMVSMPSDREPHPTTFPNRPSALRLEEPPKRHDLVRIDIGKRFFSEEGANFFTNQGNARRAADQTTPPTSSGSTPASSRT